MQQRLNFPCRRPLWAQLPILALCAAALVLSACGGGGGGGGGSGDGGGGSTDSGAGATTPSTTISGTGNSESPVRPIVANNHSVTVALGAGAALLSNHTLAGVPVTLANMSLVVITPLLPAGISVNNGRLEVATDAQPGTLSLVYRLCELANVNNCANVTVVLTVPAAAIVANADSFNLAAGASGAVGDVLANDSLAGTPVTAARVIVNAAAAVPNGIDLSAAGLVSVGGNTPAGSYDIAYRICQTTVPSNCANGNAIVTVPTAVVAAASGRVTGRVIDATSGLGLAGVKVSVAALASTINSTSDSSGNFTLTSVPAANRVTLLFTSSSHADGASITAVSAGGNSDVQVRLLKQAVAFDLPAVNGGTLFAAGSPASVFLPPNALQSSNGNAASGNVRVGLTPISPAADSSVLPGDYSSLVAGVATPIDSYGALELRLRDSSGAALALRAGQTAVLRIPVATRSDTLPKTLSLFSFDSNSGRWLQEGSATLGGTEPDYYYEGQVSRSGIWTAAQALDAVRVSGCVVDASGARVASARISSDGVDYSGITTTTTDAAGNFGIHIRLDSQATLTALANGVLSSTERVGPFTLNSQLPGCLTLGTPGATVMMKLTWGELVEDLDAHLFAPDGSHISFDAPGKSTAAPFAALDIDDISSYGPEVLTLTKLMVGTYKYAVHNFDGQAAGLFSRSDARVELHLPGRAAELFVLPNSGESSSTHWWTVLELDVDAACNVTVRRVNAYATTSPSAAAVSAPRYCSR
jgi:Carboxypeptidase regulatory-like domain